MQVLHHILHLQRGLDQQAAQPDSVSFLGQRGLDDGVRRLLDAKVHHAIAVVGEDDVHQVLADVVDVALHCRQHDGSLLAAFLLLHLGFEIGDGRLHHARRVEHGRQLHLARAEQVTHGAHAIEQHVVDELQRRVGDERVLQQFGQRLLARAVANRLFAVDNRPLQLVFDRERVHMRGGGLFLAPGSCKVRHVNLQRVAV